MPNTWAQWFTCYWAELVNLALTLTHTHTHAQTASLFLLGMRKCWTATSARQWGHGLSSSVMVLVIMVQLDAAVCLGGRGCGDPYSALARNSGGILVFAISMTVHAVATARKLNLYSLYEHFLKGSKSLTQHHSCYAQSIVALTCKQPLQIFVYIIIIMLPEKGQCMLRNDNKLNSFVLTASTKSSIFCHPSPL